MQDNSASVKGLISRRYSAEFTNARPDTCAAAYRARAKGLPRRSDNAVLVYRLNVLAMRTLM